jgi:hypothetical protein
VHLRDAYTRPEIGRLDEERIGERALDPGGDRGGIGEPLAARDHYPVGHPQAAGAEDDLHHRLVHTHRRGEDAAADIRDVGQLEQSLYRAVLAVGPVEHGEQDIETQARERGGGFRLAGAA